MIQTQHVTCIPLFPTAPPALVFQVHLSQIDVILLSILFIHFCYFTFSGISFIIPILLYIVLFVCYYICGNILSFYFFSPYIWKAKNGWEILCADHISPPIWLYDFSPLSVVKWTCNLAGTGPQWVFALRNIIIFDLYFIKFKYLAGKLLRCLIDRIGKTI